MSFKEGQLPPAQEKLYHEKQVKALCALHALNNLFQKKQTFTKKDLDEICDRLSPGTLINPHRSMLGLGNYDVNVLMAALQEKGYETIWFDKRKNVNVLVPGNIMGFILNTPSAFHFGPLRLALHCKHWIALRWLQGEYMNLDSKLSTPAPIGDEGKLVEYLHAELEDGKKELLLVVKRDVYDANSWRKCDSDDEYEQEDGISDRIANGHEDSDIIIQKGENSDGKICDKNLNSEHCPGGGSGVDRQEHSNNSDNSEKTEIVLSKESHGSKDPNSDNQQCDKTANSQEGQITGSQNVKS